MRTNSVNNRKQSKKKKNVNKTNKTKIKKFNHKSGIRSVCLEADIYLPNRPANEYNDLRSSRARVSECLCAASTCSEPAPACPKYRSKSFDTRLESAVAGN